MSPDRRPGILDALVEIVAKAMDALGFNGTRLRWRWNQRRRDLAETGLKTQILVRSARTPYKMCPSCRALVTRSAWRCEACGAGLAGVRAPGIGRLLSNLLPGATATTGLILLLNGALFVLMLWVPVEPVGGRTVSGLGQIFRFNSETLLRYGGGFSRLTFEAGEWWRLVTPLFLHGGLLHFAMNSWVLLGLGPLVEEEYGTERFAAVYLASGLAGSLLSQLLGNNTVGASGAICGLIGLLLVHGWRRGGPYGEGLKSAMMQNAIWILIISFLPGVDLLSHVGGFVGGFVLGWITPYGPFRGRATAVFWELVAFAAVGLVLGSLYLMAIRGPEVIAILQGMRMR